MSGGMEILTLVRLRLHGRAWAAPAAPVWPRLRAWLRKLAQALELLVFWPVVLLILVIWLVALPSRLVARLMRFCK